MPPNVKDPQLNITNQNFQNSLQNTQKELNKSPDKAFPSATMPASGFKKQGEQELNNRISSATSNCFRNTHYTFNSSGSKFFPNLNNTVNNFTNNNEIPTREIKSSYSTFRPKYDYSNLLVEKNNIQAKQKELAEKRNKEEMKIHKNCHV